MTAKWVNIEAIGSYFQSLPDPRHTRNRKHLLIDIVVIAVCGMVCGCDGVTANRTRERTLGNNLSWLRRFAVTLLKRHPVNDSIRGKMIRCMLNTDFLTEVLTLRGD